MSILQLIYFIN